MEINLLESTTFTLSIKCQIPGEGVDVSRDFNFRATFKALPQDEWEDLVATASKSEALSEVLESVDGVPGSTLADGTAVSPVEVAIRNPFTCDALFAHYVLYVTRNGRAASDAVAAKNSKRSRRH